jgi:hypothetical protein
MILDFMSEVISNFILGEGYISMGVILKGYRAMRGED